MPWYRGLVMDGARTQAATTPTRPRSSWRASPNRIRGYEDIKLRSIAKVRGQALTLVAGDSAGRSA